MWYSNIRSGGYYCKRLSQIPEMFPFALLILVFPIAYGGSLDRCAATMAPSCELWRPDRGRCFKTFGIVIVLFMDLVLQCVNGMI